MKDIVSYILLRGPGWEYVEYLTRIKKSKVLILCLKIAFREL